MTSTDRTTFAILRDIIASKTGYLTDMIEEGMDLEVDLGVDSIRKVEILSEVRKRLPGLPPGDSPEMTEVLKMSVISEISGRLGELAGSR